MSHNLFGDKIAKESVFLDKESRGPLLLVKDSLIGNMEQTSITSVKRMYVLSLEQNPKGFLK